MACGLNIYEKIIKFFTRSNCKFFKVATRQYSYEIFLSRNLSFFLISETFFSERRMKEFLCDIEKITKIIIIIKNT